MPKFNFLKILAILSCFAGSTHALEITVATGDYAPFTGQDLEGYGTVNARLTRLAEASDIELNFEFMPWKRALEATRRGNFVATSFWYFSEDREADFIHVGPLIADRLVFFGRDDRSPLAYESLSDLQGYTIGIVPGYTYTPEFWALVEDGTLTVSEGPSDLANFRKLVAGRIDLLPVSEEAGWHMASENLSAEDLATLTVLDVPLAVTNGYLLIPRSLENAETIAARLQSGADVVLLDTVNE